MKHKEGKKRAKYGDGLIKEYGHKLSQKYGKKYGARTLERSQLLFLQFPISGSANPKLTWTHYRYILQIKNINERNYYINQVIMNNLSVIDLKKEIKNRSFDRLSYTDKENVEIISDNNQLTIKDMIKNPIILKINDEAKELDEATIHKNIISLLENKFLELGFVLINQEYTTSPDIYVTTYLLV